MRVSVANSEGDTAIGRFGTAVGLVHGVGILIHAIRPVIDDPQVGRIGRIQSDPGRLGVRRINCPARNQRSSECVLKHLVGGTVVDDPQMSSVGDDVFGILVGAIKTEVVGRILAVHSARGSVGVPEYLVAFPVHDPDIGTIRGNAFDLSRRVHTASRPGTNHAPTGVVDVDLAIDVGHPDLVACRIAGRAARLAVVTGQRMDFVG